MSIVGNNQGFNSYCSDSSDKGDKGGRISVFSLQPNILPLTMNVWRSLNPLFQGFDMDSLQLMMDQELRRGQSQSSTPLIRGQDDQRALKLPSGHKTSRSPPFPVSCLDPVRTSPLPSQHSPKRRAGAYEEYSSWTKSHVKVV